MSFAVAARELFGFGCVVHDVKRGFIAGLRVPLAVIAAAAMTSCASSAGTPSSQVTLHETDFGRSIAIHVGATVTVDLMDRFFVPGSAIIWSADSSNTGVLQRTSVTRETPPAIMNAQAHYVAVFKAVASSDAVIEATGATSREAMNPAYCQQQSGTISVVVS